MKNIDTIDTFVVEEDEETIAEPCYNCPSDHPRLCDCAVCEVADD